MSEGKKFAKTDSTLTPEKRLEEVERKFEIILQRIQSYDKIIEEFALLKVDIKNHGQLLDKHSESLDKLNETNEKRFEIAASTINSLSKAHQILKSDNDKQNNFNENITISFEEACSGFRRDIDLLKVHVSDVDISQRDTNHWTCQLHQNLSDIKKCLSSTQDKIINDSSVFSSLEQKLKDLQQTMKLQMDSLMNSLQNMPQFNEWATKIYIKVCNEINEKQKAFHQELDKRSQQLTQQLASDPYTADSVKRLLQKEMDAMALDGKNAYLKATNAAQQIQLLEKKIENINLILKKYELNK